MAFGMATVQGLADCHPNMASTAARRGKTRHGEVRPGKARQGQGKYRGICRVWFGVVWRCDAMPGAARHGRDKAGTEVRPGAAWFGSEWQCKAGPGSAWQGRASTVERSGAARLGKAGLGSAWQGITGNQQGD